MQPAGAPLAQRIARERRRAQIIAGLASAPLVIGAIALFVWLGIEVVKGGDNVVAGLLVIGVPGLIVSSMIVLVSVWTYRFLFAWLTPARASMMWLRRFQAEGDGRFRVSRIVDGLGAWGLGSLTLQDRDVQLSWEQRRSRMGGVFWLIYIPLGYIGVSLFTAFGVPALVEMLGDRQTEMIQAASEQDGPIAGFFAGFVGIFVAIFMAVLLVALAILGLWIGSMLLAMLLALAAGPIGAMAGGKRDDFPKLPRLLRRFGRRKPPRGASIVRIRDENWRDSVQMGIAGVDAIVIDISEVTDAIAWEIGQALSVAGPEHVVFIARTGAPAPNLSPEAGQSIRSVLGMDLSETAVVRYPASDTASKQETRDFRRRLLDRLHDACSRPRSAAARP